MKKTMILAIILVFLAPAAAFATAEVTLGGFVKLQAYWDSTQNSKNMNLAPARNNDYSFHHGRMHMTSQGSRVNLTLKGPQVFGAQTSGFIEFDFNCGDAGIGGAALRTSGSYAPSLRHAMFRFNWPVSELLFGQYWSMFSEWYPEVGDDGPFMMTGTPTARLAQVRFTQEFMGDWTVAALMGDPNQALLPGPFGPYNANINNGQSAESPQVQGKIQFQRDFWGKAAYYGRPIPFTAKVVAGWQRNVMRGQRFTYNSFGENNPSTFIMNVRNQYLNPWLLMGSLFIPVIPTHSANLAGSAAILTQWWIGQGVESFGFSGIAGNIYRFNNNLNNLLTYEASLLKKFGGFVLAQYYFNNHWFANVVYGISKAYGLSRARSQFGGGGYEWAFNGRQAQTIQQLVCVLWYRPVQAIKFGVQYAFASATYFQYALPANAYGGTPAALTANPANSSRYGDEHRVEFVGFYYF
jgi:hypothetical protein